jgi:hypothetical protein
LESGQLKAGAAFVLGDEAVPHKRDRAPVADKTKMRPLQNRRSGFSAESRNLQFAGEMRQFAETVSNL